MKTESKIIITGAFFLSVAALLFSGTLRGEAETFTLSNSEEKGFACTMDAKVCPDGSFVGRVPPYCQFAGCPHATALPLYE